MLGKAIPLIGLALFWTHVHAAFDAPTVAEIEDIKTVLTTAYRTDTQMMVDAVRLGFHDCVGGCDGCINLNNASNNGLTDIITFLEAIYASYSSVMSRADFWQLASITATEMGIDRNNRDGTKTPMPDTLMIFRWGRTDCATAPTTTDVHTFPSPTMSRSEMMTYFDTEFQFTENEVTALMGAHTFGGANATFSGYAGMWVIGEAFMFNTRYYEMILDSSITFTNTATDRRDSDGDGDRKWQWNMFDTTGTRIGMMLNTDMELAYDIPVDSDLGTTSCAIFATSSLAACPDAATKSLVQTYATDTSAFWDDYRSVYDKMQSQGYRATDGSSNLPQVVLE